MQQDNMDNTAKNNGNAGQGNANNACNASKARQPKRAMGLGKFDNRACDKMQCPQDNGMGEILQHERSLGMNQSGNIIVFILIGFVVLALIPVLITTVFEPAKLVMQLILIFVIYTTVRGYLGPGNLSIIVSAVLIYFMVFKWFEIFLSLYILQLLLGLGFMSAVVWGIGTTLRR